MAYFAFSLPLQQDEQNTDFLYFKMHDRDGNGMLDGTELTRMFMEDDHDSEFDEELMRVCCPMVLQKMYTHTHIRIRSCGILLADTSRMVLVL
jgi:hypothetical protein